MTNWSKKTNDYCQRDRADVTGCLVGRASLTTGRMFECDWLSVRMWGLFLRERVSLSFWYSSDRGAAKYNILGDR